MTAYREQIQGLRARLGSWHRESSQLHRQREGITRDLAVSDDPNWTRRFYMLNTNTWTMFHAPKKWKHFSAPLDSADQRVSRYSLDFRGVLVPMKINGNALAVLA